MKLRNILKVSFLLTMTMICLVACSDDDSPTISNSGGGTSEVTFTDIDGNVYHEVKIGTQTWMKENLKTTRYRNGAYLSTNLSDIDWQTNITGACADYNNDPPITVVYGKLYNWYATTNPLGLCPTNWHVPSDSEWTVMANYLGGDSIAGGKMKEIGLTHWSAPNFSASDSSGFKGLPGGYRLPTGAYYNIYAVGFWWSSTQDSLTGAYFRSLNYLNDDCFRNSYKETYGFSVRCIKD
jgi:uncharacterized protein (TIGR02145 family)